MSLGNLSGVAFITGAGSGIGRETAIGFAHCGAKLILVDRSRESLEGTTKLCKTDPKNMKIFDFDIQDDKKLVDLIQSIPNMADFGGRLDYAINCAGIGAGSKGLRVADSEQEIDDVVLNVNIRAQGICNREQIKIMLNQEPLDSPTEPGRPIPKRPRGCIVNIASYAGFHGGVTAWSYTATKHAVVGLTKTSAATHARDNIRVNAVAPGVIDTPIFGERKDAMHLMVEMTPIKRAGDPYEIADSILYLCSDKATFVHGAILNVDGAWHAG